LHKLSNKAATQCISGNKNVKMQMHNAKRLRETHFYTFLLLPGG